MGKTCTSCGADIDMPRKPDDEDELCPDCEAMEEGNADDMMGEFDEEDDM